MKTNSVIRKLSKFKSVSKSNLQTYFYSRKKHSGEDRAVLVVDQGGQAICLPVYVESNGCETVAFHAKSIKSLIEFLECQ